MADVGIEFSVKGMQQIQQTLRGLKDRTKGRVIRRAMNKALNVVAGDVRVPEDTGKLESTLRKSTREFKKEGTVLGKSVIGREYPHVALYLEKGTRDRYQGAKYRSHAGGLIAGYVAHGTPKYVGRIDTSPPMRFMAASLYKNENRIKWEFLRALKRVVKDLKASHDPTTGAL